MKQRKKIETLKMRYPKQVSTIRIILIAIICIIGFTGGYCFSSNFIVKKMTDTEFEMYGQLAQDFYNFFENTTLSEISDKVTIEKDGACIIVYPSDKQNAYERVVAKKQDGKVMCEKDANAEKTIETSVIIGMLFALFSLFISFFIYYKLFM